MKSFVQFIGEDTRESNIGWLIHGDTPIVDDAEHSHEDLSSQGLALTTKEAVKAGHVRYFHHHEVRDGKLLHHAGYEFNDTRKARKLIDDHLATSGGFHRIDFDVHHRHGPDTSHNFRSVEDARKHLATPAAKPIKEGTVIKKGHQLINAAKRPHYDHDGEMSRVDYEDPRTGKKSTIGDWIERHEIPKDETNHYVFYHATPKTNTFTHLKADSKLETDPDSATHFAGRDRGLKPHQIKVHQLRLRPSEINGGHWASLRKDHPVADK
jgi:hypothetical protein